MSLLGNSDRSLQIEFDDVETEVPSVRGGEHLTGRITDPEGAALDARSGEVTLSWGTDLDSRDGATPVRTEVQPGDDGDLRFDVSVPSGPCTYHGDLFSVDWTLRASVEGGSGRATGERSIEVHPGDGTDYQPGSISLDEVVSEGFPFEPGSAPTSPGDHPADKPGRQSTSPVGCSTFLLLGFGLVTLPLSLWLGWAALMGQLGSFNTGGLLATLPLLLFAGTTLWSSIYPLWQQFRYSSLRLDADPKQIQRGNTVEATFHYEKSGAPPFEEVQLALRKYEQTTIERHMSADDDATLDIDQESTDVETETAWRAEDAASRNEGPLQVTASFRVPESATPSFYSPNAEVGWAVDVWVKAENAPDWDDSIRLAVVP